jgi:hypothetical protein
MLREWIVVAIDDGNNEFEVMLISGFGFRT